MAHGRKTEKTATLVDALLVGCAQAVATLPGISRSGATIAAGLTRGYKREFAVRYSFLLSLPAVLGANLLSLIDVLKDGADMSQFPIYIVGVAVAAVAGFFSLRLLNLLAQKGKFGNFAYYCWGMGVVALICGVVL
jgi:undecaprenyl-diphosphatase